MGLGIFSANILNFVNGTTEDGPSVTANDNQLKTNGINNDGVITTDGSGNMTLVSVSNASGIIRGIFLLTAPYQFASAVTLSSGVAQAFTVAGHGTPTIPSGAKFALVSCYWAGSTSGVYVQMYGTAITITDPSNYPMFGQSEGGTNQVAANGIVSLDTGGVIHALANSGNATSFNASVIAFFI